MPPSSRHGMVDIFPHLGPKNIGQIRRNSGGTFYMTYMKDVAGCTILHRQTVEKTNQGIANGLEKKQIQRNMFAAWEIIFKEGCLIGLVNKNFCGMQDPNGHADKAELNESEKNKSTESVGSLNTTVAVVLKTKRGCLGNYNWL